MSSIVILLAGLPVLPATGNPPSTIVHSRAIDVAASARGESQVRADGRMWLALNPELAADTVMVAAEWANNQDLVLEIRTQRGGAWSEWTSLPVAEDHGPDVGSAEAGRAGQMPGVVITDPVWVGVHDQVALRVAGTAASSAQFTLHEVGLRGGDGLSFAPGPPTRLGFANAATAQPDIITRAAWGADESLRRYTPRPSSRLRFAVVHHTAGGSAANSYSAEEADDVIRAIYGFHTQVRDWDDLGYNFIVDRFGRIYEGRAGGVTEAIIGAHAAGFNGGATGVALLGDFSAAEPPAAATAALERLLAWKLDLHHVDPTSHTTEVSGEGGSNRFEPDAHVELPTIFGHRGTNNTSCPGDRLNAIVSTALPNQVYELGLPKAFGGLPQRRTQTTAGTRPQWQVEFTEPMNWRLSIRDSEGALVRSTGGTSAQQVDLTWDLRDGDDRPVRAGNYRVQLQAWTGADGPSSGRTVTAIETEFSLLTSAARIAGDARIETAVATSEWGFPSARRAVLASSGSYADALAATPLAGSLGSPVLLIPRDEVPTSVLAELERLATEKVYIVGGEARIGPAVVEALEARDLEVVRLAGSDRYETAAAVAKVVIAREDSTEVVVALGNHSEPMSAFPDALSAGALAAQFDLPLLLTRAGDLPEASRSVLASQRWPDGVTIVGGDAAVSPQVAAAVGAASRARVARLAGSDRYETSRQVVLDMMRRWERYVTEHGSDPNSEPTGLEFVVASGRNWPDALGAGAAAARQGALFLLVHDASLTKSPSARKTLSDYASETARGLVIGGSTAVSKDVYDEVEALVLSAGPHRGYGIAWPVDPWVDSPGGDLPPVLPTLPPVAP